MECDIYKPKSSPDIFILVPKGSATQDIQTLSQYGELVFVKSREVTQDQVLLGTSGAEALQNIFQNRAHILRVPTKSEISEGGAALGGGILGASIGGPFGALVGAVIGLVMAENAKKVPDEL